MSQPNVVPRVNSMIQSMERPYIDLTDTHQTPAAGTHGLLYAVTGSRSAGTIEKRSSVKKIEKTQSLEQAKFARCSVFESNYYDFIKTTIIQYS